MRLIVMLNLPTFWVTTFLKLEEKEELKKGIIFKNENDTGRTRTHNFWVCTPKLYQLSWRGGPGMGAQLDCPNCRSSVGFDYLLAIMK